LQNFSFAITSLDKKVNAVALNLIDKRQKGLYDHGMGANTKYKDSLFSFLFSDPGVLRELYCALEGVTLPEDIPITINTLRDILFIDKVNDISFEIGGQLVVLIEHQSTINPNMALRLLGYIARVYEKILGGDKSIYGTKPVTIPRPEFFVLYNGVKPYPEETILRLSDLYESISPLGLPEGSPALELVVKVINIKLGKNEGIVKKSETLSGYSAFVGKVQDNEKEGMERGEAIEAAIEYCIEQGILKEFFEKNRGEVMSILFSDWNMEDAQAMWYEEGMEKGMEKGLEKGLEKGMEKGRQEGMEKGREDTARKALAKGLPIEVVQEITGLDFEVLNSLR
jgi:hypothetical protein